MITETIEHLKTAFVYSEEHYVESVMAKWVQGNYQGNIDNYVYEKEGRLLSWEFAGTEVRVHPTNLYSRYYGVGLARVTYVVGEGQVREETPEIATAVNSVRDAAIKALLGEVVANEDLLMQLVQQATALSGFYRTAGMIGQAEAMRRQMMVFSSGQARLARLRSQFESAPDAAWREAERVFNDLYWDGELGANQVSLVVVKAGIESPEISQRTQAIRRLANQIKQNATGLAGRARTYERLERLDNWANIPDDLLNDADLQAAAATMRDAQDRPPALPRTAEAPWADDARRAREAAQDPFKRSGLTGTDDDPAVNSIDAEGPVGTPNAATAGQESPFGSARALPNPPFDQPPTAQANPFLEDNSRNGSSTVASTSGAGEAITGAQVGPDMDFELATLRQEMAQVENAIRRSYVTVYRNSVANAAEVSQCERRYREVFARLKAQCHPWMGRLVSGRNLRDHFRQNCPEFASSSYFASADRNDLPHAYFRFWSSKLADQVGLPYHENRFIEWTGLRSLSWSNYSPLYDEDSGPSYCSMLAEHEQILLAETIAVVNRSSSDEALGDSLRALLGEEGDELVVSVSGDPSLPQVYGLEYSQSFVTSVPIAPRWVRGRDAIDLKRAGFQLWPPPELQEIQSQLDAVGR